MTSLTILVWLTIEDGFTRETFKKVFINRGEVVNLEMRGDKEGGLKGGMNVTPYVNSTFKFAFQVCYKHIVCAQKKAFL